MNEIVDAKIKPDPDNTNSGGPWFKVEEWVKDPNRQGQAMLFHTHPNLTEQQAEERRNILLSQRE